MNIRITKTTFEQDPEWLMSAHKVHVPGGVTIDSSKVSASDGKKIVKAGTPIGRNKTTGKWEPYDGDPSSPNVVPTALLFNEVDVTGGDEAAGAIIHGVVNLDRLPSAELIDARVRLNIPGITFFTYDAANELDDLLDEVADAIS